MDLDLIDKNKIRADNYISMILIIGFLLYALSLPLDALLSVIIYPLACLGACGVLNIISALNKKNNIVDGRHNKLLSGIIFIVFSAFFLWFFLSQPSVTLHRIVSLITFPMIIVAFAAIIKGTMISIYSERQRKINIIIGFITFIISILVLYNILNNFLLNIVALSITLLLNIFSRAALYLSEYGLSVVHIKNLKLFFYIISDYLIVIDSKGNLVLSKV